MKITQKNIIALITTICIVSCCQSQNKIPYKIKAKLDSLYPYATIQTVYKDKYLSDTVQEVGIICHCDEALGEIVLAFDTNSNLLNKDIFFNSLKELPDTILHYIKMNSTLNVKFYTDNMIKSINYKGEVSYGVTIQESTSWSRTEYLLRFKNTGELISRKKMPGMRQ